MFVAQVPAGPVNRVYQLSMDPGFSHSAFVERQPHAADPQVACSLDAASASYALRRRAGEHTPSACDILVTMKRLSARGTKVIGKREEERDKE